MCGSARKRSSKKKNPSTQNRLPQTQAASLTQDRNPRTRLSTAAPAPARILLPQLQMMSEGLATKQRLSRRQRAEAWNVECVDPSFLVAHALICTLSSNHSATARRTVHQFAGEQQHEQWTMSRSSASVIRRARTQCDTRTLHLCFAGSTCIASNELRPCFKSAARWANGAATSGVSPAQLRAPCVLQRHGMPRIIEPPHAGRFFAFNLRAFRLLLLSNRTLQTKMSKNRKEDGSAMVGARIAP